MRTRRSTSGGSQQSDVQYSGDGRDREVLVLPLPRFDDRGTLDLKG